MKKTISAILILAAATASAVDFSPVNVGGILSVAGKQDTLPYDTNAIPWSAIAQKPTIPSAYLASASATDTSITVTDNGGEETSLNVQYDYGLTNLTGTSVSLASGQIGAATVATNIALSLDFAQAADRSGDCLLYVYNADSAADHYITPTNAYHYVSSDIAAALKLAKATTNVVMFSRLTPDTVLVSKQEVK